MKKGLVFISIVLTTLVPKLSFGWSITGHHIIAEIAYLFLSEPAKQKLQVYLSGTTIQNASTWMDEQRRNPAYQYLSEAHFINIEKGKRFSPGGKNNLYTVLTETMLELEHIPTLSPEKTKYDLELLIHLVSDLHQPLHVGYGEDKGGNAVNVSLANKKMNLHLVYDLGIIELKDISTENILPLYTKLSRTQVAVIEKGSVADWINESRSYLPFMYGFENNTLNQNYVNKAVPLIENQLLKAGIRLSNLLEKYLEKVNPKPLK